jgi:hypothetical protein
MARDDDRPGEEIDTIGLFRFTGYVLLIIAAFVGYFHVVSWVAAAAEPQKSHALLGAIGVLMLTAVLPLIMIMLGRTWRDNEFATLDGVRGELTDMLHHRSPVMSAREVINRMIVVYAEASSVNARVGRFVTLSLVFIILVCALFVDHLAHTHFFNRNQANLLIVFMLASSFGFWCLLWPEDQRRADHFDPSGVIAAALGR